MSLLHFGWFLGAGFGVQGWGDDSYGVGYDWKKPQVYQDAARVFEASGLDLKQVCFHGPIEDLLDTKLQQPALVTTSLAINAAIRAHGIVPDYVVGHSVGEFAALGAAESLSAADAIRLVRERGIAMALPISSPGSPLKRRSRPVPATGRRRRSGPRGRGAGHAGR